MRTVEIKARIQDYEDLIEKIYKIKQCTQSTYSINLIDKFYLANDGKLMLRKFGEYQYAALISYKRSNEDGLQMCTSYGSFLCHNLTLLEGILRLANGFLGIVKKKRHAYYTSEAQINIDNVDTLGNFVKIKVVDKDVETAKKITNDLMQKLSITSDDLITKSYIDLILEKNMENELEHISNSSISDTFGTSETSSILETSEISKMTGTLETSKTTATLGTLKTTATFETSKIAGTLKMFSMLETPKMSGPLGTSEMSAKLGTSKMSGTLGTSEMSGTLGTSEISDMLKTSKISDTLLSKHDDIK